MHENISTRRPDSRLTWRQSVSVGYLSRVNVNKFSWVEAADLLRRNNFKYTEIESEVVKLIPMAGSTQG